MNKTQIALKYRNALVLSSSDVNEIAHSFTRRATLRGIVTSFSASVMKLGFVFSKKTFTALCALSDKELAETYKETMSALRQMKGADVRYVPLYPNFPQQVMEADGVELFLNALIHYWTVGEWKPNYEKLPREVAFEHTTFREIGVISEFDFNNIFGDILSSKDSISATDKATVTWFIQNNSRTWAEMVLSGVEIPFKENMCYVAGILINKGFNIEGMLKTATDVLRVATYLSDGDISLAANTKFRSLPRSVRRQLINVLDNVATEEDIARHAGKWVKLFHNLHVGEYCSKRLYNIATKVRNNQRIETFNSNVEMALASKNIGQAVELLVTRPGDFARRLDHLLRLAREHDVAKLLHLGCDHSMEYTQSVVISAFRSVVDQVPTRILLQILGNLKIRSEHVSEKYVFPKGDVQNTMIVPTDLPPLATAFISKLRTLIESSLITRFNSSLPELGKVWIDPDLKSCPLPTQQRSASEGLFQVARGTRLPFGDDKNTLRFFIYWVGQDIDLSASLHDENFKQIEYISYTNLRSRKYQACHSGDITYAPNGASEFIDITIDKAVEYGARYVMMHVYIYSGPDTFAEHDTCYAGWMTRSKPKSNEIYDPKTVEQKIDVRSATNTAIPVAFDLVERKAIWVDLSHVGRYNFGSQYGYNTHINDRGEVNNIEAHRASSHEMLKAIVNMNNKVSLYELFKLHGIARGTLVENKEEADTVFSMYEGITPYNITEINSKYVI